MIGLPTSAILADRDPALLDRLVRELGRRGILVEALSSPAGLTTDLVGHARPELLVLDAGLPGLEPRHAAGLVRALKQTTSAHVVLIVEGTEAGIKAQTGVDAIVPRAALVQRGIDALGLPPGVASIDPRRVIDTVIGGATAEVPSEIEARLDLLSDDMVAVGADGRVVGVFVATHAAPPLGTVIEVKLTLFGKMTYVAQGRVAWVRGSEGFGRRTVPGLGLWLDDLGEEARAALARLTELREPLTWTA